MPARLEETYTAELYTNQSLHSEEQKILSIRWKVSADYLVIDVSKGSLSLLKGTS